MKKLLSRLFAPIVVLCFVLQGTAHADRVDSLVSKLRKSDDYKVRLSAATSLSKSKDARAIKALIEALKDSNKNVRAVAATSLGKSAKKNRNKKLRKRAENELRKLAKNKKESKFVRQQAERGLAVLTGKGKSKGKGKNQGKGDDNGSGNGDSDEAGGVATAGIYVNVGEMTDKASEDTAKMRKLMRKTIAKTIAKKSEGMTTEWPGGKDPSAKQLKASKADGYHVDGTLLSLAIESKGSTTLVSCKISMLIATYPKKSMFGFLDGGAKVQAGSSEQDVRYAKEDCVAAVVEDLVARKIIPTIQSRKKP